jgi:NAD+ kinase
MTHYSAFAKNPAKIAELRAVAAPMGFVYDDDKPDFMITIGGDGTFLLAERRFPGIPKLLIRDSFVCFKCHDEPVARMLEIIKSGTWRIEEIPKLKVSLDGTAPTATNDIVIRNADPRHALRFRLRVDDEPVDDVLIGDGVVVATPFGSTGYFHSVTGRTFATGIGIGSSFQSRETRPTSPPTTTPNCIVCTPATTPPSPVPPS